MHKKIKNKILIFFFSIFSIICILTVYIYGYYRGILNEDALYGVSRGALSVNILNHYEMNKNVDELISGYEDRVLNAIIASPQYKKHANNFILKTFFSHDFFFLNKNEMDRQVLKLANYKGINNLIRKCDDLDGESRDSCHAKNDSVNKFIKENHKE